MKVIDMKYIIIVISLFGLASCGINDNVMFKSPKGADHSHDSIPMQPVDDYHISKDDKFTIYVSTSYGQNLINQMSGIDDANGLKTQANPVTIQYLVDSEGKANLPIIGKIKVEGLTVSQLEDTLAKVYDRAGGYNNPYVKIELTNQRVIVFPGDGGDAKVVPLLNNNTTLMEALATAGGLAQRGKANTIKLIRMEGGKRKIYYIDLSTEDGIHKADLIVQANDYIYVEPQERYGREVLAQVAPFVSLLASIVVMITILTR